MCEKFNFIYQSCNSLSSWCQKLAQCPSRRERGGGKWEFCPADKHLPRPSGAVMPILWNCAIRPLLADLGFLPFDAPHSILCLPVGLASTSVSAFLDDYHLIIVLSRLWLRLMLQLSSRVFPCFCYSECCHPYYSTSSLILSQTHTVYQWLRIGPFRSFYSQSCPRLDCLTWCTGLYLWLKFLILRIWQYKRNDCICIFFLRCHNRNITKIYYNLFLVQILFLVSSVT